MRLSRWLVAGLVAVLVQGAPAQGRLDTVLAQMDAANAKFQSAEAEFRWDLFERVTRSTSSQTGTNFFQREKNGATEMGAKIVSPTVKLLSYKDGVLQVFDPAANTLIRIAARGNQQQYEGFLTLGFGASGKDLARAWAITDRGAETVDGVGTEKLDLVAKDANVKAMFTHVVVWIDLQRGIALKQEFYTPSEDKRTVFNTKIRYNARVDKKGYEIKPNGKTQVTNR